ncbi:helix-turn-helix transcriptional regulator [Haloferula chungangensis]|uniref:Helix-turn-helix transcriptional regulator n=1 Tax=Haloferula chungangensis TaxID=1048331 RepID=A0ABW2LCE0_9BACT
MTKQNGNAITPPFNDLAASWANGRGSTLSAAISGDRHPKLKITGPGFLYRWDHDQGPIGIKFLPEGVHLTPTLESQQYLVIEVTPKGLSARSNGHPTHNFPLFNRAHRQQLNEIINDARNCSVSAASQNGDTLPLIIAAQRLVALGRQLPMGELRVRKTSNVPAKQQFVTDLHRWLSSQVEKSVKLGDAAEHFKKSPRQLIRILKETTGSGFAEHLTAHRLTLARHHLMRTDISIKDVARKSGFNSREQFIRSFSKAFSWTPLQFRKAWNKAALSNSDLKALCQVSDRDAVSWFVPGEQPIGHAGESNLPPHTLIVANALHEIIELFSVDANGKGTRVAVLDRGAMEFISRDKAGSQWLVRSSDKRFERIFVTPAEHAIAVISSEV